MTDIEAAWEVEGFIRRLLRRNDADSERLVLEAISHLRGFSRDCDALRETNAGLRDEIERLRTAIATQGAEIDRICKLSLADKDALAQLRKERDALYEEWRVSTS